MQLTAAAKCCTAAVWRPRTSPHLTSRPSLNLNSRNGRRAELRASAAQGVNPRPVGPACPAFGRPLEAGRQNGACRQAAARQGTQGHAAHCPQGEPGEEPAQDLDLGPGRASSAFQDMKNAQESYAERPRREAAREPEGAGEKVGGPPSSLRRAASSTNLVGGRVPSWGQAGLKECPPAPSPSCFAATSATLWQDAAESAPESGTLRQEAYPYERERSGATSSEDDVNEYGEGLGCDDFPVKQDCSRHGAKTGATPGGRHMLRPSGCLPADT
jgi:hypothetical protein